MTIITYQGGKCMSKKERFVSWIKNYGYLVLLVVGFLTLLLVVTFASVSKDNKINKDNNKEQVDTKPLSFGLPVLDATIYKGYSGTRLQWNATLKQYEAHKAIDFVASEDSNVLSVLDGTITKVYSNYLDGTVVEITHENNLKSIYGSLDETVNFKVGDKVLKGDIIGKISKSAKSELDGGAHLHFELRENDKKIDPTAYLNLQAK